MAELRYLYDIDDRPPFANGVFYGLQWAVILFPALIILANLSGAALHLGLDQQVRFLQLTLLSSGAFCIVQSLWGHRYPVLDGPSSAILLTYIVVAPHGLGAIQGGMILGGTLLIGVVVLGKLDRVLALITPNVVGVILVLIAFTLLPFLSMLMTGANTSAGARVHLFIASILLTVCMAAMAHWSRGFWKTISLLTGIVLGSIVFYAMGGIDWKNFATASWVALPLPFASLRPALYWPALAAFSSAYLAVIVNSLGSLQGVAGITDPKRLPSAIRKGLLLNGIAGVVCGFFGIVGLVSYSTSPGVILTNRVASRFAVTYCGAVLIVAAFVPKLAALLASVPAPVVGAALCVAMGGQVGAGIAVFSAKGFESRDYFVVGVPLLVGTLVAFLPREFVSSLPVAAEVFLGNGLVVGIFLVLILEHVVLRSGKPAGKNPPQ